MKKYIRATRDQLWDVGIGEDIIGIECEVVAYRIPGYVEVKLIYMGKECLYDMPQRYITDL